MYKKYIKRLLDFSIVLVALLTIWPVLLCITTWLHFANKGAGAFFTQERPGKDEKIFTLCKFRTMTVFEHEPLLKGVFVEGIDDRLHALAHESVGLWIDADVCGVRHLLYANYDMHGGETLLARVTSPRRNGTPCGI